MMVTPLLQRVSNSSEKQKENKMSFLSRLKTRCRRKMAAKETIFELNNLSNKDLKDLGINRGDIPFIAKKSAKEKFPLHN